MQNIDLHTKSSAVCTKRAEGPQMPEIRGRGIPDVGAAERLLRRRRIASSSSKIRGQKEGLFNAFLPVYQGGQIDRQADRSEERTTDKQSKRSSERARERGQRRQRAHHLFRRRVIEGVIYVVIQSIRRRLIPSPSWPPIPLVSRVMMTRSPRGSCS